MKVWPVNFFGKKCMAHRKFNFETSAIDIYILHTIESIVYRKKTVTN